MLQLYGLPWPVTEIALLFFLLQFLKLLILHAIFKQERSMRSYKNCIVQSEFQFRCLVHVIYISEISYVINLKPQIIQNIVKYHKLIKFFIISLYKPCGF
jgi:hypothetical protein